MAVLFRQSMLLNSILCNSEVLYGLKKSHIETLESVDKYFWRKVFNCPISTPTETFFMESNTIPLRFILISRRLMYYWNIVQMDDSQLVKRVFNAQKISSCQDDWYLQISEDMKTCNINLTENEMRKMKKFAFKKLIKQKIYDISQQFLINLKLQHSKSKNIWPSEEIKSYLTSSQISTEEKMLLFLMKCRMSDVKCNYKMKYGNNLNCSLCQKNVQESESHLLQCEDILSENGIAEEAANITYNDIYGNLNEQIRAVKLWKKIFKIKTWKLENRKLS